MAQRHTFDLEEIDPCSILKKANLLFRWFLTKFCFIVVHNKKSQCNSWKVVGSNCIKIKLITPPCVIVVNKISSFGFEHLIKIFHFSSTIKNVFLIAIDLILFVLINVTINQFFIMHAYTISFIGYVWK